LMAGGPLGEGALAAYRNDGYVLARGMFDAGEIELLRRSAKRTRPSTITPIREPIRKADPSAGLVEPPWRHDLRYVCALPLRG